MSDLNQVQALVAASLAANTFFAGVTVLLEFDPAADATSIAQMEAKFEDALATSGVVIVVLTPFAEKMDESKDGGLSLAVTVPVIFVESLSVNRGPARAAVPASPGVPALSAVTPFGYPASQMMEQGLKSLINGFKFPHTPVTRPVKADDGCLYYQLLPMRRHQVQALLS
jgi:hypothetical protein